MGNRKPNSPSPLDQRRNNNGISKYLELTDNKNTAYKNIIGFFSVIKSTLLLHAPKIHWVKEAKHKSVHTI